MDVLIQVFECIDNKYTMVKEINNNKLEKRIRELEKENLRLKEERDLFKNLTETVKEAYVVFNRKSIIYANTALEKIFRLKSNQAYENPFQIETFIHPEDKEKYLNNLKKEKKAAHNLRGDHYRIQHHNGEINHVWIHHTPLLRKNTKDSFYITHIRDLASDQNTAAALPTPDDQKLAILNNIPYLAWLKDVNGQYILANQMMAESYDVPPASITGKTDFDICDKQKATELLESDKQIITSKKGQFFKQIEILHGKTCWYDTYKSPVFDDQGRVIAIAGISRDIIQNIWGRK